MTFFLVSWAAITYTCPGGLFGGLIPAAVKPFVCDKETTVEQRIVSREEDVLKMLRDDVPDIDACAVAEVKNGRLKDIEIHNRLELKR